MNPAVSRPLPQLWPSHFSPDNCTVRSLIPSRFRLNTSFSVFPWQPYSNELLQPTSMVLLCPPFPALFSLCSTIVLITFPDVLYFVCLIVFAPIEYKLHEGRGFIFVCIVFCNIYSQHYSVCNRCSKKTSFEWIKWWLTNTGGGGQVGSLW